MGPHWPQDGPWGVPTVIWRNNRNFDFLRKIDSQKFEFWGMVTFYGFDPFFLPNGTPLAPRCSRGSAKVRISGMVIFCGFDPFLLPNGTPLTPRWTLGGPHRDLAPLP